MSKSSHPRISITTPSTPGEWAHLEREIIDKLNAAAPEFVARYTRSDGSLIWRDVWPSMDVSDDPYEAFMNLALFYSIGGNEEVYQLCLLYTSDAADDLTRVDLGGRRIIKKKNKHWRQC